MSYRRELPKLNRENFSSWQELMKLHLSRIGDNGMFYLEKKYVPPPKPITVEQMKEAKDHNIMMIDIASSLNYSKIDEATPIKHWRYWYVFLGKQIYVTT